MNTVFSAGFGAVLGGLLYLVPGGVIFSFPAALLPFVLAISIEAVLGAVDHHIN
jgi:hypothetical protein